MPQFIFWPRIGTLLTISDLRNMYSLILSRRITVRVRKLLLLIPTDPAVQEALDQLDSLGRKVSKLSSTYVLTSPAVYSLN